MPSDAPSPSSSQAGDPDIDRLKQQLSFYESFDQLIQTNVSQAGSLLREAIDLRENAAADAEHASHQIEAVRTEDRERYRALFSLMLDELTGLQGQAERLARRLSDAIDQLESELGPGTEFLPLQINLTAELSSDDDIQADHDQALADEGPDSNVSDSLAAHRPDPVALESGAETAEPEIEEAVQEPAQEASLSAAPAVDDVVLVASDEDVVVQGNGELDSLHETPEETEDSPLPDESSLVESNEPAVGIDDTMLDTPGEPATAAPIDESLEAPEPAQPGRPAESICILLAHGVPRAATALSLKRHLESLDHVQKVEPREFAAGVLRLQLHVVRDVTALDLEQWTEITGFTAIRSRPGLLEIQLRQ